MGFYQNQIVPILTDLAMRQRDLAAYRSRVVPAADGRVLEIGVGSGLNLPFYSPNVRHLIGLDPSPKLLSMARRNSSPNPVRFELIEGSAESIPLQNESVDTVVTTWTLCSIPDAGRALREMYWGTETCGTAFICGTRTCSPAECMSVARPSYTDLETPGRWLSS
jgi:ubiquinone/menaquinone biosynthesis C-methylase UbiE